MNHDSTGLIQTTQYMSGYEKIENYSTNATEHRYHISVGGSLIAVHSVVEAETEEGSSESSNYLHKDALGSVALITDKEGVKVERQGFTHM